MEHKHKHKGGMIDNRMVNDNHQQGIERVKQRSGDLKPGQGGHMQNRHHEKGDFKRPNSANTPRLA